MQLREAAGRAFLAQGALKKTSRYLRSRLLAELAGEIQAHRAQFIDLLIQEAGKPYTLADAEVSRALVTVQGASEEAKRFGGEVVTLDHDPTGRAYDPAVVTWVPRGVVLAITPFNFPLNLVVHKVAPALASGNAVLLKPSPHTPGAAKLLVDLFERCAARVSDTREQIPGAALQFVPASNDEVARALGDPRIATLSFTGSAEVGWALQKLAVRKKVLLELGGNAAAIVHEDADLERAATRCAFGGFAYAGQTCISVQRVLVHAGVATRFEELFIGATRRLGVGDPCEKSTVCGPLINTAAADRVWNWIQAAKENGAQVLLGGERHDKTISPVILKNVAPSDPLWSEEVFGPVVVVKEYSNLSEAIAEVNRSRFGLQAGIFTRDLFAARQAAADLEMGGVIVNDVPTYRADPMPYGGLKDSGLGREGVRYAMEECSERKVVVNWVG